MKTYLTVTNFETTERNTNGLISMKIILIWRKNRSGINLLYNNKDCDGSSDKVDRNRHLAFSI
jgi:hypothetical protein